nr:DUF4113 domain-containing protein [Pseudomonas pharmacofabricae]
MGVSPSQPGGVCEENCSPAYTTRWSELMVAKAN